MKKTKLQTRFFLAYLSIVLAVVIIFSIFFYQYTSKILIERETQNIVNLTSTFQVEVDQAVKSMDTISINVGYSNLIMQKLEQYFSQGTINWSDTGALSELFVAINGTDSQVDQINIYDFIGNVVGFGRTSVSSTLDLSELEWFKPTCDLNGLKYISLPYNTAALSKTTKVNVSYISLYRTYYNKYGKQVGIIETMQNSKKIFKNIITYEKKNEDSPKVYVYNENGVLIYPYNLAKNTDLSFYDYYYHSINKDTDHILLKNPETNNRELIAHRISSYTDWVYITAQPEETILKPVQSLSKLLFGIIIVMIAISSLLSYYMSLSLTRPIKQLMNIIRKTELATLGEHDTSPLGTSFDELEKLNQAFKSMSTNLKISMNELIDSKQQELKSRSMALQSQINPHFYYNSLSSIIILAENNQPEDVITLCRSLSSIMRYITKGSSPLVTIEEEMNYIRKYLYCMKVRYQSSLNYTIDIDVSILDLEIPKLIIQPLVENALKYGTNCIPPWSISVVSTICDDYWRIDVIDSGNGFTKEAIQLMDQRIKAANETKGMPEIEIDGMGLLNVYSRWKLYCENDYIFTYQNLEGGGGIVSIGRYFLKNHIKNLKGEL